MMKVTFEQATYWFVLAAVLVHFGFTGFFFWDAIANPAAFKELKGNPNFSISWFLWFSMGLMLIILLSNRYIAIIKLRGGQE
jgi:hypothetical protein